MPRVAGKRSKTGIYHIILRGINRQTIFEDNEDAIKFLQILGEYKDKSEYKVYACWLMGNHVHILIREGKEGLVIETGRIEASYVYWYNWKYERTGYLFQDRYKSEAVEDDKYLLTVLRYIHRSSLKVSITKDIKEYRWSSYNEYINKSKIIDNDFILDLFRSDRNGAKILFEEFHKIEVDSQCLEIDETRRLKDNEAIEIIKKICNITHCIDMQRFHEGERDRYPKIIEKWLVDETNSKIDGN